MQQRARKRLGQNFLHDSGVIQRIVDSIAPKSDEHLVEIGPGQGAITTELLRVTGSMDTVELDRDLIGQLGMLLVGLQPLPSKCG